MQNNNEGPGGYTIFLGGPDAVTLAENKKNKKEMTDKYLPLLDQVYPGVKDQWSGEAEIAWWPVSKAIKGSYSAYKVGQYSSISGYEVQPVGNMLFAGEHCSYEFQGFMNGGAESGKRAATALIKMLNG
jgi:monoamine oxidase